MPPTLSMYSPSLANATFVTCSLCPLNALDLWPLSRTGFLNMLISPKSSPVAMMLRFLHKATELMCVPSVPGGLIPSMFQPSLQDCYAHSLSASPKYFSKSTFFPNIAS